MHQQKCFLPPSYVLYVSYVSYVVCLVCLVYMSRMSYENENIKIYIHLLSDINMKQPTAEFRLKSFKVEKELFYNFKKQK